MSTLTPEPHTPTPLQERIARAMWAGFAADQGYTTTWEELAEYVQGTYLHAAAAVLPTIAAEVRKGRAAALREAAGDIAWSAETLPHMTPHDAARGLVRRAERIEQED